MPLVCHVRCELPSYSTMEGGIFQFPIRQAHPPITFMCCVMQDETSSKFANPILQHVVPNFQFLLPDTHCHGHRRAYSCEASGKPH